MSSEVWSDKQVELLKKLWAEGKTFEEIAGQLPGKTKNSVAGKLHRLKMRASKDRADQTSYLNSRRARPKKSVKKPKQTVPVIPDHLFSLVDMGPRMCRYIFGKPGDSKYGCCGAGTIKGSDYCEQHHRVVFTGEKALNIYLGGAQ